MWTDRTEVGQEAFRITGRDDFADGKWAYAPSVGLAVFMTRFVGAAFEGHGTFPVTLDEHAREIVEALFAEWYGLTDRAAEETPETIDMRPGPLAGVLNINTVSFDLRNSGVAVPDDGES